MADQLSILLPYQKAWIADGAGVKVCEKSRRGGLTWAEAADDTLQAAGKRGMDVWYIAYEKEIAREFIEDCADWARRFNKAAKAIEEIMFEDEDKQILAYRIEFPSGHKIVALSSRPRNLRGRQGIAVLDEFAFVDDPDELLKAAMAFLIWGGKVRIISTHNGAENKFNELVNDIRADKVPYSLHRVTWDDALSQGLYRKVCEKLGRAWTVEGERAWNEEIVAQYRENADEELYCIPRAGGAAPLPTALIEARMSAEIPVARWACDGGFMLKDEHIRYSAAADFIAEQLEPIIGRLKPDLMSFFGMDFGRSGDLTVIWPMQLAQGLQRATPFTIELRNVPFQQQRQILFWLLDRLPRFTAGAMDARGNGQDIAEGTIQKYGERVQAVMLSVDWYRENMPRYVAAFQDATIELPKDADILADHRALRTEKGVTRVPEKRTRDARGNQRHGDSAIAGALAYYATVQDVIEYAYTPAAIRRPLDERMPAMSDRPDDDDDRIHVRRSRRFGAGAW